MTAAATAPLPPTDGSRFVNRELSWLDFNARVLALAEDQARPLLERAKFLAIFSQNLDEFFQVRVSGLEGAGRSPVSAATSPDGLDPAEQLRAHPERRSTSSCQRQAAIFTKDIAPALEEAGIRFADWDELDDADRAVARRGVRRARLPRAHPARGRPGAPVPLHLQPLAQPRRASSATRRRASDRFARVKVPPLLPALHRAARRRAVRAARAGDRGAPRLAVPGDGHRRAAPVPRDPRRRLRARGRGRGPPRGHRDRCCTPLEVRRRRAPRGRHDDVAEVLELLCRELELARRRRQRRRRAARPLRALGPLRPRPSRAEGRAVARRRPSRC